jgi:hypothetical protein
MAGRLEQNIAKKNLGEAKQASKQASKQARLKLVPEASCNISR